jgi:hypothetical protein
MDTANETGMLVHKGKGDVRRRERRGEAGEE